MLLRIKWVGVGIVLIFLITTFVVASPTQKEKSERALSSRSESTENMLHSLALYILAAEMLGYFQNGEGDAAGLAQKYQKHPGWIPAFANGTYDRDEGVLYVPLGQCVWKIFSDFRGDLQFGFLQPKDKGLEESDKMILVRRLFQLANDADRRKEYARSQRNTQLAAGLLYTKSTDFTRFTIVRSAPTSSKRGNCEDSL